MSPKKHLGLCPFCKGMISPVVVEQNGVRRDICKCPECEGSVLVCRSPGCDNYAKGGNLYDEELCPECTRSVTTTGGALLMTVATTALSILTVAAMSNKDE